MLELFLLTVAKKFTLGKKDRLKSRKSIEQLFIEGKKISASPFRVIYMVLEGDGDLRFGAAVSARHFKKAKDRNRIKRLTREAWRLQKNPLQEKLKASNARINVFFIYIAKDLPSYQDAYSKVGEAINKLVKVVKE
jgi:ribonuclease P protein component